jgi:methylamine--corrinoid protein Co-methyltransferase
MRDTTRLLEIVDRSLTGPVIGETDFDMDRVVMGLKRVVAEYGIEVSSDHVVNLDDDLADRVWQAAIDYLAGCGVYSKDTGRVIEFTREEILERVRAAPDEVPLGEGPDARTDVYRTVADANPPQLEGGPVGSPMANELWVPIMRSYIQEPLVDMICGGTLLETCGREIRTESPTEILACWEEVELMREAREQAGRPGISTTALMLSISDIGHLSATSSPAVFPYDLHTFGVISELKTNNDILNKVAHITMLGGILDPYANPIYGGLGGGVAGQAVLITASMVALSVFFLASCLGSSPTHPLLFNDTGREVMTATSLAFQAMARNARLLTNLTISPVGGPSTETLLYECAAYAAMSTVSGTTRILGPRSATGVIPAHFSGLEARFTGEMMHAVAGMDREQVEEITQRALAHYEPVIDQKPYGKPFTEVYDLDTIQPTREWLDTYEQVKAEVASWGVPFGR